MPNGYAHPTRLSPHAIERWSERHRRTWRVPIAIANLMHLMKQAELVEIDAANLQAIWKLPEENGVAPLLVVDAHGTVRTVLPRYARKSSNRGHPPALRSSRKRRRIVR